MSIALMTAAWALEIGATDKIVLLALADRADDDGKCWPGIASLAKKCGLSDRSVQRAIQALADAGHLSRNETLGVGCTYHVHPRHSVTPDRKSPVTDSPKTPDTVSPNTSVKHQRERVLRAKPFDEFWKTYPKRVGKLAAERALDKAIKRDGFDAVMNGARRYAEHIKAHPPDDDQFIPHPATWLNRGSYDDEIKEPSNGNANNGNRGRLGGSDKPPVYRRSIGLEMLRELRDGIEADEGPQGGDSGTGLTLSLPARH